LNKAVQIIIEQTVINEYFKIMKFKKLFLMAISIGAIALISSCKGPEGPAGAAGTNGTNGVDGTDGTPGVAGNAVCMECHNLTVKAEITAAWETSGHGEGNFVGYAGGRNDCAKCHSDQGFRETQYTGQDTTVANVGLPQPIQCGSCHDFHQSLDFENEPNYALRTMGPVDLIMYRAADPEADPVTINLGDNSNLCANCHQPRRVGPDLTEDSAYVSSSHYGPHHGPQSTSLAGLGASELGTGYPAPGTGSAHATSSTCTTCHMHSGDHTWEPSLASCNDAACHNGALTTVTDNTRQLAFATSMATLATKLTDEGLLDVDGHPVKGTFEADFVGALYNYEWLVDDRSNGVHNFPYLERMLANSIAVF
jgi:hypothetical protein